MREFDAENDCLGTDGTLLESRGVWLWIGPGVSLRGAYHVHRYAADGTRLCRSEVTALELRVVRQPVPGRTLRRLLATSCWEA